MKDVLAPAALVFEITERITSQKDLFNLDHSDGSRSLEITVTLAEALTARYQRRQQPGEDEWIMVNAEVLAHLMTVCLLEAATTGCHGGECGEPGCGPCMPCEFEGFLIWGEAVLDHHFPQRMPPGKRADLDAAERQMYDIWGRDFDVYREGNALAKSDAAAQRALAGCRLAAAQRRASTHTERRQAERTHSEDLHRISLDLMFAQNAVRIAAEEAFQSRTT